MAIPAFDTSMTFDELALTLAEDVGYAEFNDSTGLAELPEGQTLAMLRRAVNEGYMKLARANPKWRVLMQQYSLTFDAAGTGPLNVGGRPEVYALPPCIQHAPIDDWTYDRDDASVYTGCVVTSIKRVNDKYAAAGDTTGIPSECAIVSGQSDGNGRPVLNCLFYPKPDNAYTVTATFRITPVRMIEGADRHVFGSQHDEAIRLLALAHWRSRDEEQAGSDLARRAVEEANEAVAQSILLDRQLAPRRIAPLRDSSGHAPVNPRLLSYTGVTTYNGQSIL